MFYNARWYDPALGRFAQADTIIPSGVQGYDRYAYVQNNPLNYSDPSGHIRVDDEGGGGDIGGSSGNYCGNHPDAWVCNDHGDSDDDDDGGGLDDELKTDDDGSGGCHMCAPTPDDIVKGGDGDVGYTINYGVGVVVLNYYGQYSTLNLNELDINGLTYQAWLDFQVNANSRVTAKQDLALAQGDFIVHGGIAVASLALGAMAAVEAIPTAGLSLPITIGALIVGLSNGHQAYDDGMAWGIAAGDLQDAITVLETTWSVLK